MKNMLTILLLLVSVVVFGQQKTPKFVGSNKCKTCHNKAEVGSQYSIWLEGSHASSLETLKSDASKAIAKKMGLKTDPTESPECLICHVTGWGTKSGYQLSVDPTNKRAVKTNGDLSRVGCESCHGPGSVYKSKKNMIGIAGGSIDGASMGLTTIVEATCTVCHNSDSPTFKPFDFAVRVKEVSHPIPEK